jgi:hypothetical protein
MDAFGKLVQFGLYPYQKIDGYDDGKAQIGHLGEKFFHRMPPFA